MRRQVSSAPIKGKMSPAPTKRGNPTVSILKIKQPIDPPDSSRAHRLFPGREVPQRKQRACRVIGIRNTTRQISPRPAPGRCPGVFMDLIMLLRKQPVADSPTYRRRKRARSADDDARRR